MKRRVYIEFPFGRYDEIKVISHNESDLIGAALLAWARAGVAHGQPRLRLLASYKAGEFFYWIDSESLTWRHDSQNVAH